MGTVFRGELASMLMVHVLGVRDEGTLTGRSEASAEIFPEHGRMWPGCRCEHLGAMSGGAAHSGAKWPGRGVAARRLHPGTH